MPPIPQPRDSELIWSQVPGWAAAGSRDLLMSRENLGVLGRGSWRSLDYRGQGRPGVHERKYATPEAAEVLVTESKSGTLGDRAPEDSREHHCMHNPIMFMPSVLHTEMVTIFLKRSSDFLFSYQLDILHGLYNFRLKKSKTLSQDL